MAGSLTLDSWPGPSGDPSLAYFDRGNEQNQFGRPSVPGVLPSRSADLFGSYTSELKVVGDSGGMRVLVSQGRAVAGIVFAKVKDADVSGGVYTLDVTASHATLQRVDRVVLEFNLTTGVVTLKMSNGTATGTGSGNTYTAGPPALVQSATTYQVPLALVVVDPAVTTIAAQDVVDNRQFSYTLDSMMRALEIANPIINGGLEVWQRGTSFSSIADAAYGPDRWRYGKVGAVVHDLTQSTDVPAVAEAVGKDLYSTKLDVTTADSSIAAGDYCILEQRVEGYRAKRVLQRGFTLPFWVKQPAIGVYYKSFVNSGGDRSCVCPYFIEAANTWELHWVHVPASPTAGTWDYATGIGVRSVFTLSCGSTFQQGSTVAPGTWQTGLFYGQSRQVNAAGDTAYNSFIAMVGRMSLGGLVLPFSPHDDEEGLCERYFTKTFPRGTAPAQNAGVTGALYYIAVSTAGHGVPWPFRRRMRTTPTITTYNPSAANDKWRDIGAGADSGTPTVAAASEAGVVLLNLTAESVADQVMVHATAVAEL